MSSFGWLSDVIEPRREGLLTVSAKMSLVRFSAVELGAAGDGCDGGAPHRGVRVGHVSAENVDHQQADIWVVSRGLDDQVTHRGLQCLMLINQQQQVWSTNLHCGVVRSHQFDKGRDDLTEVHQVVVQLSLQADQQSELPLGVCQRLRPGELSHEGVGGRLTGAASVRPRLHL